MSVLSEMLMPFAPRWLGVKSPLSRQNNLRNFANFYLHLSQSDYLWTYFPVPTEGTLTHNLAVYWDDFLGKEPPRRKRPNQKLIDVQPTWPISEIIIKNDLTESSGKGIKQPVAAIKNCAMEPAGWYQPAHFGVARNYGIHLSQGGLVHATKEIHALCPDEPRDVVLVTTCYFVYCHLLAHAWMEDVCAIADFMEEAPRDPQTARYTLAHHQHGSLLLMEERLCNLYALSSLPRFLSVWREAMESRSIPQYNPENIINAIRSWLIHGRQGDQQPMVQTDPLNVFFLRGMKNVMNCLYGYGEFSLFGEKGSAWDAISLMTGVCDVRGLSSPSLNRSSRVPNIARKGQPLMEFDQYPVIVHRD